MTKETMNVHQALRELKLLDKRIEKGIEELVLCKANRGNNKKIQGVSIENWKVAETAKYQSVTDLISRRKAIKKALSLSNAVTTININERDYTVAEAIELKRNGIYYEKELLEELEAQYSKAVSMINKNNLELEKNVEDYLVKMFGTKETNDIDSDIEAARDTYIKNNTYELVETVPVTDEINRLREYIYNFESKIDSSLSVSNAMTTIEIEY